MYDILRAYLKRIDDEKEILRRCAVTANRYAIATIHRAENTDNAENLLNIFEALREISWKIRLIIPLHPRTEKVIKEDKRFEKFLCMQILNPLTYREMLVVEKNCRIIFTDSGGVQKEAFWFKKPCITMRDRTEWVETVKYGYNILTGANKDRILKAFDKMMNNFNPDKRFSNIYGDGRTSIKIAKYIRDYLCK